MLCDWWYKAAMGVGRGPLAMPLAIVAALGAIAASAPAAIAGPAGARHATRHVRHHRRRAHRHVRRGAGIHLIKHVVIVMQENRSFDSYFGTYPGADGIPGLAGHPGKVPCVPDPATGGCQKPYHDPAVTNAGGPHTQPDALADIDGGKMDG